MRGVRCFFRVEYEGSDYVGWQYQPNGPSIQAELERAFSTVVRENCKVVGAGRTDAGVHARAQGAHVDLPSGIDLCKCQLSVNALLPAAVAVYGMRKVADSFHARFSARRRRYRYYMMERKTPLWRRRAWMVFHTVNWERVRDNAQACVGTHDFSAFCRSSTDTENMVCTVEQAALERRGEVWVFSIQADRFVYTMVRSVVGTLVDIGRGRLTESFASILAARDRARVGETAPARGLVLDYVSYDEVA
ncbi:MAG: tRNA pseudouridine(38-40) synthase TruA [Chitinivibrionales bacterium]|nr:tRNA pseudouridine(38-40) synthase TruA [Chitinivibrionales bacterium]MBD3357983.1 tRNA pseudouridine(38-40) synthase TruA [Chitinivibrionales bacterium]